MTPIPLSSKRQLHQGLGKSAWNPLPSARCNEVLARSEAKRSRATGTSNASFAPFFRAILHSSLHKLSDERLRLSAATTRYKNGNRFRSLFVGINHSTTAAKSSHSHHFTLSPLFIGAASDSSPQEWRTGAM